MKVTERDRPVAQPEPLIIIELSRQEAILLRLLVGSVSGVGPIRTMIVAPLYTALRAFTPRAGSHGSPSIWKDGVSPTLDGGADLSSFGYIYDEA